MSSSPRVTVIIATYNWSTVLPYAITSVLGQTLRDFELLVIGDDCTDDSAETVAAIDDARVRWINLPANTGHQAGPNNRGLSEARGEFIAYLGHDDLWLPHHLECLVNALDATGAAVAFSGLARFAPGQRGRGAGEPFLEPDGAPPSCIMHRRSLTDSIGGWGDYRKLYVAPETDLWQRARAAGFKFTFASRLSALKFPASNRRGVYRDRPCHEQAAWVERIRTERNLEAVMLVQMIVHGEAARDMPARRLIPLLFGELLKRLSWRLSRGSGLFALFWPARGAGIDAVKKYKGL